MTIKMFSSVTVTLLKWVIPGNIHTYTMGGILRVHNFGIRRAWGVMHFAISERKGVGS